MRRLFYLLLLLLITYTAQGQKKYEPADPSSFFPKEKAKVLVVGTFHFNYPGLDAHQTQNSDKIDVLLEPKKSEVTELVNYIKKFRPTKIAIEALPRWKATEKLRGYKTGNYRAERDERYQLGLRIASELNLDTIYAIDAESMLGDLVKLDSSYAKQLSKDFDYKSNDPYNAMYSEWYTYEDRLPSKMNLLEYFKRINSRAAHQLGHGAYLVGDFKLDDHRGADVIASMWYSRNLRIFRKLQQITTGPEDRILFLFGNGHSSIIRQLLESSPEYEFVEFNKL